MKQERTLSLRWTPAKQSPPIASKSAWFWRTLFGAAALSGSLGALSAGADFARWPLWVLGFGVYLACSALFATRLRTLSLFLGAGTILAVSLSIRRQFRAGFSVLLNRWLETLSVSQGKIYLPFHAEPDTALYAALLIGCALALLAAWGSQRQAWMLALPLAMVSAGCALGLWPGSWWLLAASALLGLLISQRGVQWQRGLAAGLGAAVLLAACLPFAGTMETTGQSTQKALGNFLHRLCYEADTVSMPEGNLQNLGPWKKSGATALELSMDEPQKLYLRGYTGERYTGSEWTSLPPDILKDRQDLFYWLHKEGFFAQTMAAQAEQLAQLGETANLTIRVDQACRRWAYLPYGLSSGDLLDEKAYPDAGTALEQDTYTLPFQTGSLAQWYQAQGALSGLEGSPYLTMESAYRAFVYDAYLQLPDVTVQTIGRLLQEEEASLTLMQIQARIRSYLDNAMDYDETVTTENSGTDFLSYVLMAQGRGYSVHYAAIATCLLRYYGVPARYVEGYFLSAEQADALNPGQSVALDESCAHAWAEFYLDGVGWIPFEVTPGYMDQEEALLQGLMEDPDSPLHQALNQSYETQQYQIPQAYVQQPEQDTPGQNRQQSGLPWELVWLLPVLLLLMLLGRCLYLRRKLRRRLRALAAAQPRQAVAGLYAYCQNLRQLSGLGELGGSDWALFAQANREALFSQHPMTQEQKQLAIRLTRTLQAHCRSVLPVKKRIWLRWIRCFCP